MIDEAIREGVLVATPDDRLAVQPGGRPVEVLHGLHCGEGLEIYDEDLGGFVAGRVEHAPRTGWYWTDDSRSVALGPGMRARGWTGW